MIQDTQDILGEARLLLQMDKTITEGERFLFSAITGDSTRMNWDDLLFILLSRSDNIELERLARGMRGHVDAYVKWKNGTLLASIRGRHLAAFRVSRLSASSIFRLETPSHTLWGRACALLSHIWDSLLTLVLGSKRKRNRKE